MKKLGFIIMPLMAVSFLVGCSGGNEPPRPEAVEFSITDSSISYDGINKTATLHLDWTPSEHSLELSNFTFTYNGDKTAQKVEQGDVTARPREIVVTFSDELISNVTDGKLSFHYIDNTTQTEGEDQIEGIKIDVAERPVFSISDSSVSYDSIENIAKVHLKWEPSDHSIEFSDFTFTYGEEKSAGKVEKSDTTNEITMTFEEGLTESVTGDLNFHYIDSTAKIESDGKVEGILINVPEKPTFFVVDTDVIYNSIDKSATVSISWTQGKYSLELSEFEFRYNEGLKRVTMITGSPGKPCDAKIQFVGEVPTENITDGELIFKYQDKTVARIMGEGKVEGIHINIPENPGLSISESMTFYNSSDKTAKVSVDWSPKDRLMEFSNPIFKYNGGTDTATVNVTGTKRPREFTITFTNPLASNITDGELKFAYTDQTAKIKGEETFNNIKVVLPFAVTCTSSDVELSNTLATPLEDYKTTITVNKDKINQGNGYSVPDTLNSITVGGTPLEDTDYTYTPTENTFSAELTIPKENITGAINIDLTVKELTPLCFENIRGETNSIFIFTGGVDLSTIDIEYCKDLTTSNWQDWPSDEEEGGALTSLWVEGNEKIYIKNTKNALTPGDMTGYIHFVADEFKISGNVNSMINYAQLSPYCFYGLFNTIRSKSVIAPALPATTLAEGCYENMFNSCNLTKAPALPATTLKKLCYDNMFGNCASLIEAPELPATTIVEHCYQSMFSDCTSLKEAPELLATTLPEYCYWYMFSGCSKLTKAPEIPATTVNKYCCDNMFSNCTSLKEAPELHATTLAEGCYSNMFIGCTALTKVPDLRATTVATECYKRMFSECKSLVTAPRILAKTMAGSACQEMFRNCKELVTVPELSATTLASQCYYLMFEGCSKLNYIKVGFGTPGSLTWPGDSATKQWLKGVNLYEGSFYWKGGISGPIARSIDTVPIGWNINP